MKTMSWILIFAMLFYSGCSSTRFIKPEQSSYDEINKKLKGKRVNIILTDGYWYAGEVKDIRVAPDSTSWVELLLPRKHVIPTSKVKEIYTKSHVNGALQGLLSGAIVWGSIGALIGLMCHDSSPGGSGSSEDSWLFEGPLWTTTPGQDAALGAILLGVPGALIGFLIGVSKGSTNKYVLSVPSSEATDISLTDLERSKVIIISERVGEVIDLEERNKYHIFPGIKGFQSAVLTELPDGRYILKVTYLDETTGEEKIRLFYQTKLQIKVYRNLIDKSE